MYHEYTQEELRSYCKSNIESLEIWARRLIHEQMLTEYGLNYIDVKVSEDEYLIKKDIRNHINTMLAKEPGRFKRPVDTLFTEHIIYFLCNPKWYKMLFKPALDYIYPQGKDEAREFLSRLIPIRNPLSHSNPITMHDVERAICYSHDFIEGLKMYYKDKGEEQMWNVPRIIKIKDSFGNVFENPSDSRYGGSNFSIRQPLNVGDTYSVEIEVDPSFNENDYCIKWQHSIFTNNTEFENKKKYTHTFTVKDVSKSFSIQCKIIQNKDWHKYSTYDGEISLSLTVLPPKE